MTPLADEEVHRDQHDLEEHEEGEQVEGEEHAHDPCLQHEQPRVVRLRRVLGLDRRMASGNRAAEHHQPERDAVETQCPRDAEAGDPFGGVDELELVGGGLSNSTMTQAVMPATAPPTRKATCLKYSGRPLGSRASAAPRGTGSPPGR